MLNFLKRPRTIVIIAVLLVLVGGYFYRRATQQPKYEFATVQLRDISAVVNVTGHIQPAQSIDLSFETGGKLQLLPVDSGSVVQAGQLVAALNNADASANVAQAQAVVAAKQASLSALRQGTRPEEVLIAQTTVDNAERALSDAKNNLTNSTQQADVSLNNLYLSVPNILNNALATANDAVYKQAQDMFINDNTPSPRLAFTCTNSQTTIDVEYQRQLSKSTLDKLRGEINVLEENTVALTTSMGKTITHLTLIRNYLNRLTDALNASAGLSASTLDSYKTTVNTARTNISTTISTIDNQQQLIYSQVAANNLATSTATAKVRDAENALKSAVNNLALKKAGSTKEQIEAAVADLRQAQANAAAATASYAKTAIHAPVAGIITKRSASVGESIGPNSPVLTMITDKQLEIEANVPEVDIGRITLGNPLTITIDAFPGETFVGKITFIDPAETVIDGVVNFRIKATLDKEDTRIKSGLTTNLTIETQKLTNVLTLPQYAIVENDSGTYVRVLENGKVKDLLVTLGARGQDGYVEIRSGVTNNMAVINVGAAIK